MGFPILERRYLYIESGPRQCLLPVGAKPIPALTLTRHQWDPEWWWKCKRLKHSSNILIMTALLLTHEFNQFEAYWTISYNHAQNNVHNTSKIQVKLTHFHIRKWFQNPFMVAIYFSCQMHVCTVSTKCMHILSGYKQPLHVIILWSININCNVTLRNMCVLNYGHLWYYMKKHVV